MLGAVVVGAQEVVGGADVPVILVVILVALPVGWLLWQIRAARRSRAGADAPVMREARMETRKAEKETSSGPPLTRADIPGMSTEELEAIFSEGRRTPQTMDLDDADIFEELRRRWDTGQEESDGFGVAEPDMERRKAKKSNDYGGSLPPSPPAVEAEEWTGEAAPAAPEPQADESALRGDVPAPATLMPREVPTPDLKTAQFTAYYPREAEVDEKYGLFVYVSVPYDEEIEDEVEADVRRYTAELGGEVPAPKVAKQAADLAPGTRITVTPESDELEFEPPSLTKRWRGTWTQFGFDFYPGAEQTDETCFVRVSVAVEGIEIAHIKAAIEVIPAKEPETPKFSFTPQTNPDRSLLDQELEAQAIEPYDRIFVSYSKKDNAVLNAYNMAKLMLGSERFVDVDSLRTREDWQAELARGIDEADVFHLYWSVNSAASAYCQYEVSYALDQRCEDKVCADFIRPLYFETPMPDLPDLLDNLRKRFRFVELIASNVQHTAYNMGDVSGGVVNIGGDIDIGDNAEVTYNADKTDDDSGEA